MTADNTMHVPFRPLITISIMLATIMQVLDTTIANVALPHMQGSLSATQDQISWVLTSYILASALLTLPVGWLSGRYGRKKVLVISIVGFVLASISCGLATSISQMVVFRIIQGCSGAAMIPLSQSTLLDINPREKHGSAMALWGMGIMIGPILGPTLGGYLTEYYNWRWVFFINIPVGLLALLGVLAFMPDSERQDRPFDGFGFITLSVLIACIQLILDRGEQVGWFSSREILFYVAMLGSSLWMYCIHTWKTKHPFLSREIFLDRNMLTSLFFIFFVGIILLASMALLPPYMQNLMGYPVLDVGVLMAPRGVGVMVSMMLVGKLSNRLDARILIFFGMFCTTASLYAMTFFSTYVPPLTLIWTGVLQGFGLGFIFVPLSTVAYSTLPPRLRAEAASLFSLVRNLGSSVGISIVMVMLSRNLQINHAYLSESITATSLGISWQQVPAGILADAAGILGMLDGEITRQALTIAYIDDFKLMMWIVLAACPLVLLFKRAPVPPQTARPAS